MAVGESPAAARRRLRLALRDAREAKGLTQREVSEALDWSLSKVNRIESGEVSVTSTDLQAMLNLYGVSDPERVAELTAIGRAARRRGWWDQPKYREHITPAMIQSLQFEAEATTIRSFQPTLIPGVLQTREYARRVLTDWGEELNETDITARLNVRMQRREELFNGPDPPTYLLILDESVPQRTVGGPRVMSEQLYDLLGMISRGSVTMRILPLASAAIWAIGLFTIYTSDDEDVALYVEAQLGDELIYKSDVIRKHRQIFERMWERCLSAEQSINVIEAYAAGLRAAADRTPDG
ncbi:MAG TPA: helix-turn-helix transcriptional regulator [Natronosporangium sp.]